MKRLYAREKNAMCARSRAGIRQVTLFATLALAATFAAIATSCGSSGEAAPLFQEGPCTPAYGTYQIVYADEPDSSACAPPATETVTIPDENAALGVLDGGILCDRAADCTETCSGTFEGFTVASTTTLDASATSYSGVTRQTVLYPDGAPLSQCAYSYQATRTASQARRAP